MEGIKDVERLIVDSSHLNFVEYDKSELVCTVTFLNGSSYRYSGVTPTEFSAFKRSKSKGKAFYKHIRGKECVKV